jgi:hypothetical protein
MKHSSSAFSFGTQKRKLIGSFVKKDQVSPDRYFPSHTLMSTLYDGTSLQKPCSTIFGREKRKVYPK